MAIERNKPYSNFNFLVDFGGDTDGPRAGFKKVMLPEMSLDVVEYRAGNDKANEARKLLGLAHYSNAVLKRGVVGALDLYAWWNAARNGDPNVFRTVTVQLLNEDRSNVVLTWRLLQAAPVRLKYSPLRGRGKRVLVEELELCCERVEIE